MTTGNQSQRCPDATAIYRGGDTEKNERKLQNDFPAKADVSGFLFIHKTFTHPSIRPSIHLNEELPFTKESNQMGGEKANNVAKKMSCQRRLMFIFLVFPFLAKLMPTNLRSVRPSSRTSMSVHLLVKLRRCVWMIHEIVKITYS